LTKRDESAICATCWATQAPGGARFTGIYILERRFLGRLEPGRVESVVPAFVRLIGERPGSVAGVVIDEGFWSDVGSLEEYRRVSGLSLGMWG